MQDYRQVYFRDFLIEPPILQNGEFICLWIHDTCDKSLQGYSSGESDDFCKATYLVENTKDFFLVERFTYNETDEKIGYFNAWTIKLYGKVIQADNLVSFFKVYSLIMANDFTVFVDSREKETDYYDIWEQIKELRFELVKSDLYLQKDCPLPELYRLTTVRILLYEILLIENEFYDPDDVDIDEVCSHLKRIAPDFPEDSYFGGPNISDFY